MLHVHELCLATPTNRARSGGSRLMAFPQNQEESIVREEELTRRLPVTAPREGPGRAWRIHRCPRQRLIPAFIRATPWRGSGANPGSATSASDAETMRRTHAGVQPRREGPQTLRRPGDGDGLAKIRGDRNSSPAL